MNQDAQGIVCNFDRDDWTAAYSPLNKTGRFQQYCLLRTLAGGLSKLNLKLSAFKRILDLGCGHGNWLNTIADIRGSSNGLVGIDLFEDRLQVARRVNPGIDFKIADMRNLPFDDNSFELVTSFASLMFLPDENDLKLAFNEIHRVLTEDGTAFLFEPVFKGNTPGTRGIQLQTVCSIGGYSNLKVTYTTPIFRKIGGLSTASLIRRLPESLCHLIEGLRFLPGSNRMYVLKPVRGID